MKNNNVLVLADKIKKDRKRRSIWLRIVSVLSSIAVFCTTYVLILPAITWERTLICETSEHTHDESCYEEVTVEGSSQLICTEEEHEHSDACITETKTLICGLEESEGHTHSEECLDESGEIICGLEESDGHTHNESCYETVKEITCGKDEHKHDGSCYETAEAHTEKKLVCGKKEHTHTNACYDAPPAKEDGYHCGKIAHKHSKSQNCFFEDGSLKCTLEEHEHTAICKSDKSADLETEAVWKDSFSGIKLTGTPSKDIVAIAETQLGYTESTRNFTVSSSNDIKGYTRYGAWYGSPYGDWCAMFASFCVHYSGISNYPLAANCKKWITKLNSDEFSLYHPRGSYTPRPGDLIFFDWEAGLDTDACSEAEAAKYAEGNADHVGIVYEIKTSDDKKTQIVTIEGNNGNRVGYHTYDSDDRTILGFGEIPSENGEKILVYQGADYLVEVSYSDEARIPDNAELKVKEILPDTDEYSSYYNAVKNRVSESEISFCRLFDISFVADGVETEPESTVNVRITYDDLPFNEKEDECQTIHFAENGIEELSSEIITDEDGQNAFSFSQNSFSVIANMLLSTPVTGTYYQRVSRIDSTTANYLIVSVEGNYALAAGSSGSTTSAGQAVKLVPVKGNAGYYTVSNVSNNMLWRFGSTVNGSGNTTIRRGQSGVYLYQTRAGTTNNRTYPLFNTNSGNEYIAYNQESGSWTIRGTATNATDRYLYIDNGTFSSSASGSYQRNMIILKQVNTTLDIPNDPTEGGGGDDDSDEKQQPTYEPDTNRISDAKQGDISDTSAVLGEASDDFSVSYASDPSTSDIEKFFFSKKENGIDPSVNDGKVISDKSVVYKGDDYDAIDHYEDGTFGVSLSVLGQDYQFKEVDTVTIPIDIVFVLDVSGSMGNAAGNVTRREAVVNAVNSAMAQIMQNPENRAGVVLYSSGGSVLLDLDHYTPGSNNQYLNYSNSKIRTANNLRGKKSGTVTQTYGETGGFTQSHGTYTQYGIALGAQILENNNDTTYTAVLREGTEYERTVSVQRKPVIVLLSDGDPTHCTSNYTDVLSGPAYGDGVYPSTTNNKGIQGYYTIMSANYYKNMVGIHYDNPSAFYTIGMGINATGYTDLSGASSTGDCYKRAVLNPSSANIADLISSGARNTNPNSRYTAANTWSISCQLLNQLLRNSYTEQSVTVGSTGSYSQLGTTNTRVPVLANPYSRYNYADGAYFGDLNQDDLRNLFNNIISSSISQKNYGFMLFKSTSVEFSDTIGEGMEMKGAPVLRYNGVNYELRIKEQTSDSITYTSDATAVTTDGSGVGNTQRSVNLSDIDIKVTTKNGIQTVYMKVPEAALASYTPELTSDWYYEELPIRLIYKVGLTDQAKSDVLSMPSGGTKTFYTNAWENTSANSLHMPHQDNPYYNNVTYDDGHSRTKQYTEYSTDKNPNATGTEGHSIISHETREPGYVGPYNSIESLLGNNGKLVFTNNTPSSTELVLKKVDMAGHLIENNPATFELYKDANLTDKVGTYYTDPTGILTITDLAVDTTYYLKEERAPDGYNRLSEIKSFMIHADGTITGIAPGDNNISVENGQLIVKNPTGYELPATGGMGAWPIYTLGILIIAAAAIYFAVSKKRNRG